MKELLKIFSVLFFISMITFSTIGAFAEDSGISNQTNDTNNTNKTNQTRSNTSVDGSIQPMSVWVELTVNPIPSVNLGTLAADGVEHTYTNVTSVRVRSWLGNGELRVRATGDFININNASQTIPLNNFQYDCPGYVTKRSFTTTNYVIDQYNAGLLNIYDETYYMNYYLRVPPPTNSGTYNTTIIYTAT